MYKRSAEGWLKHFDFILVDEVCLQAALIIATAVRNHQFAYSVSIYRLLALVLFLLDALVMIFTNSMHNVLKRGYLKELTATIRQCLIVYALTTLFMFAIQTGQSYSRIILTLTFLLHILFGYILRILWKVIVSRHAKRVSKDTMLVVLKPENADEMMKRLTSNQIEEYEIVGIVLTKKTARKEICGIPVVADLENASGYISQKWIDSVYIDASSLDPNVKSLMDDCREMAVPVHYHVPSMSQEGVKQFVEKVGGSTVLTTTINYASPGELLAKRCLDILGGLVGSLIALILMAVIGPKIKKQSPGPILYSQERVGRNGKRFRMWKLRSMYMDADERKQELMEQNRVKDGMMFKLDFDPRIIGNEILPDGTQKTGIGEWIRSTSLDEFPQFFNVLMGQMSLVGTRPPTVDEWEKYKLHHRARLACKPGITGLWQVSGRSEITDFEEVVKLDTQYITNWSLGLDVRILLKTVTVVFRKDGAM